MSNPAVSALTAITKKSKLTTAYQNGSLGERAKCGTVEDFAFFDKVSINFV